MKMFDTMRRTNNNISGHSFVNKKKSQSQKKETGTPIECKAETLPAKAGQAKAQGTIPPISLTLRSIFQEGFPQSTTQNLSLMEADSAGDPAVPHEKGVSGKFDKFPTIVHGDQAIGVEIDGKPGQPKSAIGIEISRKSHDPLYDPVSANAGFSRFGNNNEGLMMIQ